MKLIINGKYIEISGYVELIEENPIINNFDTQFSVYSNTFEIPYSGEIMDVLDISALRKTTSPYILIDCHVVDGVLLIPAKLIVMSFDVQKNTIKVAISEKIEGGKGSDGFDIRKTKLTELRHTAMENGFSYETDEFFKKGLIELNQNYSDSGRIAEEDDYPHSSQPDNDCLRFSFFEFRRFLSERYNFNVISETALPTFSVFANNQKYRKGDFYSTSYDDYTNLSPGKWTEIIYPDAIYYPAGVNPEKSKLNFTDELEYVLLYRKYPDNDGNFATVRLYGPVAMISGNEFRVSLNGYPMQLQPHSEGNTHIFAAPFSIVNKLLKKSNNDTSFLEVKLELFDTYSSIAYDWQIKFDFEFFTEIENNKEIATNKNSRQLFQNLPDITVLDFLKQIAKASAKYIEISENTITFKNISESLSPTSIIDATDYFIKTSKVDFSLYDSESLEYWYKEAEQPTLVVPISDETVKNPAKKIDIDILLTNDNNVQLFKDDGITPREGMATYPFLDITNEAADLQNLYLAIQKPQVITATFNNFEVKKNQSILVRQLNGVFIPTKTIRTNKNIIELELLKIEE